MNFRRRLDRNSSSRIHGSQASSQFFQDHLHQPPTDDYAKGAVAAGSSTMDPGGGSGGGGSGSSTQLPDDSKISQILRQLKRMVVNKQDVNTINEQFDKLRLRIWDPTNRGYINRSFDTIADEVVCLLLECPKRMQHQVVDTFACIGYMMHGSSFPKYFGFIAKAYKGGGGVAGGSSSVEKEIRLPLMESLRQTVKMNCKLSSEVAAKVIRTLKEIMENVDVEGFLCISDILDSLAQAHPSQFRRYFKDVVDIIIGWHLEMDRSGELKLHCGRVLQNLGALWTRELEFTQDLVVQVKEDIEASEADAVGKTQFGCYLGAFNTIVKCLSLSGEFCLDPAFLVDCFTAISASIGRVYGMEGFYRGFDVIENANEFLLLALESGVWEHQQQEEEFKATVLHLVLQQIELLHVLSDDQSASVLHMVNKMIPVLAVMHPEVIQELFSGNPSIAAKRFARSGTVRLILVELYQSVLNLKNVQLLKHVYTEIVQDLERAVAALEEEEKQLRSVIYTPQQAQLVMVFNLNCLTKLAMDNTSIIALYACQPSLLEVFVNILKPQNARFWATLPELHGMVVNIVYLHCRQNKNFTMSSNLLRGMQKSAASADYSKESPTSEHFEMILELLVQMLEMELSDSINSMILEWICELVAEAKGNDHFYDVDSNWKKIARIMVDRAKGGQFTIQSGKYLEQLVQLPTLAEGFSEEIAEICCHQIDSTNAEVSGIYAKILGALPLSVALNKSLTFCSRPTQIDGYWRTSVYGNRSESDVWPSHFAELFKSLTIESTSVDGEGKLSSSLDAVLWECFNKCRLAADPQFVQMAMSNSSLLVGWMQWELAKYCVNNKLKTPLGKAQDTFLHIEGLIRKIARVVDGKEEMRFRNAADVTENQVRSRVIMGFVEALEKCIYNAAEGTAYAYPVLEKPIKAFFKLNATTCNEWFKRNRIPTEVAAAEMMDSDIVVRNAVASLSLCSNGECTEENRALLEQNLVALVRAYLRLGDPHSILGLFEWTKRKFLWVQRAADQAENRFELAGQSYLVLLVTEEMSKVVKDFVAEQMFVCFCATGNYEELTPYLGVDEYKEMIKRIVPQFADDGPDVTERLSNWDQVERTRMGESHSFSMRSAVNQMERTLTVATNTLQVTSNTRNSLTAFIKEAFRTRSEELLPELLILQHVDGKIAERQLGRAPEITTLAIDKCFGSNYLYKALAWAQMLKYESGGDAVVTNMQLDLISVARKEGNVELAGRQLEQYFSHRLSANERIELDMIPRLLIENDLAKDIWTEDMVRASFEASKLLNASTEPESRCKAVKLLSHINLMIEGGRNQLQVSDHLRARMLLKIVDCIGQKEDDVLGRNKEGPLQELLLSLDEFTSVAHFNSESVVPLPEISIGKLLSHTVRSCPGFAKSWCIYGNWCYKWGRKIIELSHSKKYKSTLQYDYTTELMRIVPELKASDVQAIIVVLDDLLMADNDTDDIGPNDEDGEKLAVAALKTLPCLAKVATSQVVQVIGVWHKAHRHIYGCYEMAANAYFKFLQMDNAEEEKMHQHTVMITLRLLRLIVKHALSLQDVLDGGLAATPTGPWKAIIPQLFSRLNHHELFVRKRVSELLCRVAKDAPHIIIFPAVVGCGQGKAADASNLLVAPAATEKVEGVADSRELLTCFQALVSTLSKQASDTVAQVQVLVRELQRIGLLWDELWLVALTRVYADFNKKMQPVEKNSGKGDLAGKEKDLVLETVTQFKATLLATIEKLSTITGSEADTKNEQQFQAKYKKHIEALREAAASVNSDKGPAKIWNQFKSFYGILHQRANRRSASSLRMEDISPVLFNLRDTVISMPGIVNDGAQRIYIKSVANSVQILPTKTRPKKLAFVGNDNRQYNYLFKGLEDLHLDERIMQFLSISNTIMRKASQKIAYGYDYRAKHYSVIPLGTQSGLINWVDGVVPIFSLYKKWQQREQAKAKKATDAKDAAVMRPSELFYSKVTPLLAAHKIDVSDNRKTWPVSVLRQVLDDLVKETPKDLLAKEFWCNSTTAAGWRKTVKNYSLSVAVMSVIGYIIGLGDRHLDNVLVDVATGEILHIDYNVCFEKGKTLRVPEKIPFRMTQNFQEALGLTGIEGTFRLTCETVLQSLKKGRETLLTLLEAFVYDPLVDWTVNQDDQAEQQAAKSNKREGKVHGTVAAIKGSAADNLQNNGLRQQWKTSRDEIQKSNYALEECQRGMTCKLQQKQLIATDLITRHQELEMISNCTLDQCQILTMKYDTYHALRTAVQSKLDWTERVIGSHDEYFSKFEDTELVHFISRLPAIQATAIVFEFDSIHPIFVAANNLDLFAKSRELSMEMTTSVLNVGQTVQQVYELLSHYKCSVLDHLPKAHTLNHYLYQFRVWCEGLVGSFSAFDLSVAQCQMIVNEISYGGIVGSSVNSAAVTEFAHNLLSAIQDLSMQHQMLSYDAADMGELELRYQVARQGIRPESGQEDGQKTLLLNYTVLWELHKKYKMILGSDTSKLRYEMGLNSFLFFKHAGLMEEAGLPGDDAASFKHECEALERSISIYEWMNEIKYKFSEEVIPLAIQAIFTGDTNVIDMITRISKCYPNGELKELEKRLQESLDGEMVKGHLPISQSAAALEIKCKLTELYKSYSNEKHVGAKIFKRFYELFNTLEQRFSDLIEGLVTAAPSPLGETSLTKPLSPSKKAAQAMITNRNVLEIVKQLFLVKKVDALIEFFVVVMDNLRAFQGNSGSDATIYNDQALFNPFKIYLNDFLYSVMFHLGEHCQSLVLNGLMQRISGGEFKIVEEFIRYCEAAIVMNSAGGDERTCMSSFRDMTLFWERSFKNCYIQKMVQGQEVEIKRLHRMLKVHEWIHEDVYQAHNILTDEGLTRSKFLMQLRPLLQQLHGWSATIVKMRQELGVLGEHIKHDLQWADSMFKPLIASYENQAAAKEKSLNVIQACCQSTMERMELVISYEALRKSDAESFELSNQLLELLEQIMIMCSQGVGLQPMEARIVEMGPPVAGLVEITAEWQGAVVAELHAAVEQLRANDAKVEEELTLIETTIKQETTQLMQLIPGLRAILGEVQTLTNPRAEKDCLLSKYTRCMDVVSSGLNEIAKGAQHMDRVKSVEMIRNFNEIIACLKKTMVELKLDDEQEVGRGRSKGESSQPKQNSYAVTVWRRVRMKLEGRDPDASKRMSVEDQVDWMIKEATNRDNLAVLYEGWTPWV